MGKENDKKWEKEAKEIREGIEIRKVVTSGVWKTEGQRLTRRGRSEIEAGGEADGKGGGGRYQKEFTAKEEGDRDRNKKEELREKTEFAVIYRQRKA